MDVVYWDLFERPMPDSAMPNQLRDLFLLHRVAQRINSQLELEPLLEDIVSDVALTFGYSRAAVLLADTERHELVIAAVRGWTANVHKRGERLPIGRYGIVGHVAETGETYYAADVSTDPFYQVSEPLTRSELDIPLRSAGDVIGVFNVQHTDAHAFPPERIRLLEALAGHVGTAIVNAQLFASERREKQRLLREQEEAQRIQQHLFPRESPSVPGLRIAGVCLPCRAVGGDWYDFFQLPHGRLGIVVADVSGKGMAAALLMSSTRSILRLVAADGAPPGVVLQRLNRVLLADFPTGRFVTMVYVVVDLTDRSLSLAVAGHPPPLLVAADGVSFLTASAGLPLGVQDGEYPEMDVRLQPGTRVVLYSDGVTEASRDLEEYGPARIRARFVDRLTTVATIVDDVRRFTGTDVLVDDLTTLTIDAVDA
jgi:sigma-B regulation protein RsbU (phosphoserine phosphatase)